VHLILVKKYSNRRLYDTEGSRYITLDELADKIRQGADVRVTDAKTNEDLTQVTLTQIIIESRRAARLLPVALLTQLIRMGDDALAEFLGRYLSTALDLYLQAKQGALALTPYNPFAGVPFAATSALARLLLGGGPGWNQEASSPASPASPASPVSPPSSSSDVAELRREVEELKRSMREAAGEGGAGPKRRRK
jgi:polyhydroxyalkanoate synthesis repressor PhaR